MAIDLGTKVFYRASTAGGAAISIALVTGWQTGDKADLAVKPNQSSWFDVAGIAQRGQEADGDACWSAWLSDFDTN